jgi:flagellar basal body P-ring protein FlgI
MTLEAKQFSLGAWMAGITLLVYLAGAVYALAQGMIAFDGFLAAVGVPLGALTGWVTGKGGAA